MTPEIIARVDAWLASRKAWLLADDYRDWLHYEWASAVDRYNSHERPLAREAVAACLTGALLALVREAWGDRDLCTWHQSDRDGDAGWQVKGPRVHGYRTCSYGCDTEIGALLAALEGAPC